MRDGGVVYKEKKFISRDGEIVSEEELDRDGWKKIFARNFAGYPLFQRQNKETGKNEIVGWYPIESKEGDETEEASLTWGKIFLHYEE